MDVNALKIELVKLLLEVDDLDTLNIVSSILQPANADFYDGLPHQVKQGIEVGLSDIENGNVEDHDSVMKRFKEKYG